MNSIVFIPLMIALFAAIYLALSARNGKPKRAEVEQWRSEPGRPSLRAQRRLTGPCDQPDCEACAPLLGERHVVIRTQKLDDLDAMGESFDDMWRNGR